MLECIHELNRGLFGFNKMSFSWENVDSLGVDFHSLCLGLSLLGIIFSDSSLESFSALTSTDMLDSDVDSLGDDSSSNLFVDDDSNGMLGNIKYSSSLSVVELVWHTLVDATVGNDINVITFSVGLHDL